MEITFRKCGAGDLNALHALSCQTFSDAFAHLNTPENMKRYLNGAFHPDKLADEIKTRSRALIFCTRTAHWPVISNATRTRRRRMFSIRPGWRSSGSM